MSYTSYKRHGYACGWFCLLTICVHCTLAAQAKWDGGAGDGQWSSAANWANNLVPAATDDVLLDNSFVSGNYAVSLPGGPAAVTIRTLSLSPAPGNSIQLLLPPTNTAVPAFTATGPGYGVVINNGGVFTNSSGVSGAAAVSIADSFRINNGGQYRHNTRAAHAALVTVLSSMPGTEQGVFIFNVPGGGYTIATTNRVYGSLVLSAAASGGTQSYASSAASPFTVNGDLVIQSGIVFNLDITAATVIKANFKQEGGVFNLASQPNNNTVFIQGDFLQTGGTITETSGGLPVIELNGAAPQHIRSGGNIINSIGYRINNAAGVYLLSNLVLPFDLALVNGIVNNQSFLITLLPGCRLHADSLSNTSFINGALRKEGLSNTDHFLFPVGRDITQRWLSLKNATGNYTVQFNKGNTALLAGINEAGIHHISSIEYWSVEADLSPVPATAIELSFDNVNSGGVTDMASLRVAQLLGGIWTSRGNIATTGTPGSRGSVLSSVVNEFGTAARYFTLASSDAFQNPLPLQLLSFTSQQNGNTRCLQWTINADFSAGYFELQAADDGIGFITLAHITKLSNEVNYQYIDTRRLNQKQFYRLNMLDAAGRINYSRIIHVNTMQDNAGSLQVWPSVAATFINLHLQNQQAGYRQIRLYSSSGVLVKLIGINLVDGNNNLPVEVGNLHTGVYIIKVADKNNDVYTAKFIKVN